MQTPTVNALHHTARSSWPSRARAAGIHLALSVAVATCSWLLIVLWYPYPYRELSGGRELFALVISVDIIVGPLITFTVFNRAKPAGELKRDLIIVGLLQLAALCYGLWTVHLARPVHMVFEYDRFRVVHLVDIPAAELRVKNDSGIEIAPFAGPTVIALRQFRTEQEKFNFTLQALQGVQLSARPELWSPYATERSEVLKASRPLASLVARFPRRSEEIEAAVRRTGRTTNKIVYLPLIARKAVAWTVLLDATTADILGYLPLDPY